MSSLLEGIRVIDTTSYLSGPFLTMLLGGMGAEIIKIERPLVGDSSRWTQPFAGPLGVGFKRQDDQDISIIFLKRNRNKKSVTLDLAHPEGRDIFIKLVEKADIVVENFRPGVVEKLHIDYEQVKRVKPEIIYCSISCFGQEGPYRDYPGFDLVAQGTSGMMAITGFSDGPPLRCGTMLGDAVASLYGGVGVLAALYRRKMKGRGEKIDISMQDGLFSIVIDDAIDLFAREGMPLRTGNQNPRISPFNAYEMKDKRYLVICAIDERQWGNLLKAMGIEELIEDARFANREKRFEHREEIEELVARWARTKTLEEALEILRPMRIPCAPVIEQVDELLSDPQLLHRGMITEVEHPICGITEAKTYTFPIKFENSDAAFNKPAPTLGEHNEEIYSKLLGLSSDILSELQQKGVI